MMISITNAKLAGYIPRWAPFRGFSILSDNPGQSLTSTEQQRRLTCDVDA
jgi:hypothetical protein